MEHETLITLTADIVSAHVANNNVAVGGVATLVQQVHSALAGLGQAQEQAPVGKIPVVSVRASVKPDFIICMECGAKAKMLKRHLMTAHGMTPAAYRADYGLPREYPMVSPNYSARRGDLARASGLGRRKGAPAAVAPEIVSEAAAKPKKSNARKPRGKTGNSSGD